MDERSSRELGVEFEAAVEHPSKVIILDFSWTHWVTPSVVQTLRAPAKEFTESNGRVIVHFASAEIQRIFSHLEIPALFADSEERLDEILHRGANTLIVPERDFASQVSLSPEARAVLHYRVLGWDWPAMSQATGVDTGLLRKFERDAHRAFSQIAKNTHLHLHVLYYRMLEDRGGIRQATRKVSGK